MNDSNVAITIKGKHSFIRLLSVQYVIALKCRGVGLIARKHADQVKGR